MGMGMDFWSRVLQVSECHSFDLIFSMNGNGMGQDIQRMEITHYFPFIKWIIEWIRSIQWMQNFPFNEWKIFHSFFHSYKRIGWIHSMNEKFSIHFPFMGPGLEVKRALILFPRALVLHQGALGPLLRAFCAGRGPKGPETEESAPFRPTNRRICTLWALKQKNLHPLGPQT